jgi:hypothetical protein
MQTLVIPQTNETPEIVLDGSKGTFSFAGKSFPENVNDFYNETIKYIEAYVQQPKDKTTLEFSWIYFNTATSKIIVKIIMLLKSVNKSGKSLEIKWLCSPDDDLIIEKGNEFSELLGADFSVHYI